MRRQTTPIPNIPERDVQRIKNRIEVLGSECGCHIWIGGTDECGYGQVSVVGKTLKVHRLMYFWHTGIQPVLPVLHSCNTPCCANPRHLRQGTDLDNARDRITSGTNARGSRLGLSKTDEETVRKIREKSSSGLFSDSEIGRMFGLSKGAVHAIVTNRTWMHAAGPTRVQRRAKKLTELEVQEIRTSFEKSTVLAKKFGVTYRSVYNVRAGLTWNK